MYHLILFLICQQTHCPNKILSTITKHLNPLPWPGVLSKNQVLNPIKKNQDFGPHLTNPIQPNQVQYIKKNIKIRKGTGSKSP